MDSKDKNEFIEREGNAGVVKEEEEEENEEDEDYELELGSREESMDEILMGKQQLQGEMRKYWRQRHNLFTKYDNGCLMTRELWFSVTPELISERMAEMIQQEYDLELGENTSVLDMFCGGGGDSISFLKRGWRVLACDNNETHLNCTRHNAQIYGVDRHLETFLVDWTGSESAEYKLFHSMISIKKVDFVFGSPPWGGPTYKNNTTFSAERDLLPFPLHKLLQLSLEFSNKVALFLPRNIAVNELVSVSEDIFPGAEVDLRVVHLSLSGYSKGVLALWTVHGGVNV